MSELTLDIALEAEGWRAALPDHEALLEDACRAALKVADKAPQNAHISALLGDDSAIQALNARFRGIDKATNVLSFPSAPAPTAPGAPEALGDLAFALETLIHEAQAAQKPLASHFLHLCAHGTLHLLGFDHQDDAQAAHMEALEVRALAALGQPNPYAPPKPHTAMKGKTASTP